MSRRVDRSLLNLAFQIFPRILELIIAADDLAVLVRGPVVFILGLLYRLHLL